METLFTLNLRHLRAVPVIVRAGGLGAAAGAIGISQPALAQGLAQLEARLGVRLFDRQPGGMAATPAGAALAMRIRAADERLATALARASRRGFNPVNHLGMAQLRAFLTLADAGSYAEAAPRLALSGPALHRAVAEMERLAGQKLVERRGRGVSLTPAGRSLARQLRLAVAEYRAGLEALQPDVGPVRLVIGAMPLSRARLVPGALAQLLPVWPGVAVDIIEGAWADLVERLRDGSIDVMIGALRDPPPADLLQLPLIDDRPAVIARAGHPLANRPATVADLARHPWVTGRSGSPLAAQWQALFARHPHQPPAPVACGSVMTIRELLLASDCLTLLSPEQVRVEIAAGLLCTLATDLDIAPRRIGAVLRTGWRPSPVQRAFLAAMANVADIGEEAFLPIFE